MKRILSIVALLLSLLTIFSLSAVSASAAESSEVITDSSEVSESFEDVSSEESAEESESFEESSAEDNGDEGSFPGGISKPKPQAPKPYVEPTAWDLFYEKFITYDGWETVVDGLITTLEIALLGLLIGIVLGTLIAAAKVIPKTNIFIKIVSAICDVYVALFRGTPIVVQLLLGYFVLFPALGVQIEALTAAIAIFGMNSGAYISEIMRSGIQSVDPGQLEAARAVGLSFSVSMIKVVIPQAIKNILPTLGNEFIVLIKETSVASFITVVDITKAFKDIASSNYEYIIPYCMLALVYLVLVAIITLGIKLLERRLAKVDRRR